MPHETVEELANFINRYRTFVDECQNRDFDRFRADFRRIQTGIDERKAAAAVAQRQTAANFNIFHILSVHHDEVRTHSALLANLLSPHGSHAQGAHFLEGFLRHCYDHLERFPIPPLPLVPNQWQVSAEEHTVHGNLDLVIRSPQQGYLIVIENKIWAAEQPEQLARYSEWLILLQRQYPQQALLFLTPHGHRAYSNGDFGYQRLSYRDHLVPWLEASLTGVEAPRLHIVLTQYLDLIRSL